MAESATAFISPEELASRPKPKVVDTTALPNEPVSARQKAFARGIDAASEEKPRAAAGLTSRTWNPEDYTLPGFDLAG